MDDETFLACNREAAMILFTNKGFCDTPPALRHVAPASDLHRRSPLHNF
jgi:hypothetical protein